jgi:sulfite reductase beta subunit-like hemoprotein
MRDDSTTLDQLNALAARCLADAGVTVRAVRSNPRPRIVRCRFGGIAHDEVFDVTPYADALARHLKSDPLRAHLPRHFRIAFEGCRVDHVAAAAADLGFRAVVGSGGSRGLHVTVGGAARPVRAGYVLHEFLPASEVLRAAHAVIGLTVRLSHDWDSSRGQVAHLIRTFGWTRWKEEYERELGSCRLQAGAPIFQG